MSCELHSKTASGYFQKYRKNISVSISLGENRILDVGCGAGNFGAFLKESGFASEVVGLEIDHQAASEAMTKLDEVFCVDLNQTTINEIFSSSYVKSFDYIICADVLEHLIDPWIVLKDLVGLLGPGGKVVASMPNVRHWTVWLPLIINGSWNYVDAGIMDRTHLRFFTKRNMQELFTSSGLKINEVRPLIGGRWNLIDKLSLHLLRDFVAVQWVIVGSRY
jgi:2-polyprenyl-3-methyl-5-hydroxy-6-metoxy-1,4-benzoquinol methylase